MKRRHLNCHVLVPRHELLLPSSEPRALAILRDAPERYAAEMRRWLGNVPLARSNRSLRTEPPKILCIYDVELSEDAE
jgi:hypothetical protein